MSFFLCAISTMKGTYGWYTWFAAALVLIVVHSMLADTPKSFLEHANPTAADKAHTKVKSADHRASALLKKTSHMISQLK